VQLELEDSRISIIIVKIISRYIIEMPPTDTRKRRETIIKKLSNSRPNNRNLDLLRRLSRPSSGKMSDTRSRSNKMSNSQLQKSAKRSSSYKMSDKVSDKPYRRQSRGMTKYTDSRLSKKWTRIASHVRQLEFAKKRKEHLSKVQQQPQPQPQVKPELTFVISHGNQTKNVFRVPYGVRIFFYTLPTRPLHIVDAYSIMYSYIRMYDKVGHNIPSTDIMTKFQATGDLKWYSPIPKIVTYSEGMNMRDILLSFGESGDYLKLYNPLFQIRIAEKAGCTVPSQELVRRMDQVGIRINKATSQVLFSDIVRYISAVSTPIDIVLIACSSPENPYDTSLYALDDIAIMNDEINLAEYISEPGKGSVRHATAHTFGRLIERLFFRTPILYSAIYSSVYIYVQSILAQHQLINIHPSTPYQRTLTIVEHLVGLMNDEYKILQSSYIGRQGRRQYSLTPQGQVTLRTIPLETILANYNMQKIINVVNTIRDNVEVTISPNNVTRTYREYVNIGKEQEFYQDFRYQTFNLYLNFVNAQLKDEDYNTTTGRILKIKPVC
jgi:hypothetical protein